jgi:hemerythrin-like metal-binding protein
MTDRDPQVPDALYKALPYLYAGCGAIALSQWHSGIGLFSGAMLLSAGAVVWWQRRRHRLSWEAHAEQAKAGSAEPTLRRAADHCVQITWRDAFSCDDIVMDAQHKRLFDLGNAFINAGMERQSKAQLTALMSELVAQISAHFLAEAVWLARSGRTVSDEQKLNRGALLAKARQLSTQFSQGEIVFSEVVGFVIYDLVVNHVVREATDAAHGHDH